MMSRRAGNKQIRRSRVIVPLLVATLVLAVVLAYEAVTAASAHRAAAENTLRDYAASAAWQFERAAGSDIEVAANHALRRVPRLAWVDVSEWKLPDLAAYNVPGPDECDSGCPTFRPVRHFFAWDHASDAILLDEDHAPDGFASWLRDSLSTQIHDVYQVDWPFAVVARQSGDEQTVIVYRVARQCADGTPDQSGRLLRTYGFEADAASLAALFDGVVRQRSLLPPALIEKPAADSLLSVVVRGLGGSILYDGTAPGPPDFVAQDWLSPMLGGFAVELGLNRQIAPRLLIGGLPRSRAPFLLAVVLLAAGLIVVAVGLMRREAELVRIRSEFVAGVSHELRTPLAQIRMFAETLLLGRVRTSDEERRSLTVIDQEARRLSQLVENVLLFSKAENGSTRLCLREQALGAVVRDALASFAPIADARQVRVRCDLRDEPVARVDAAVFGQVIVNLLDNAVKYGPVGQEVTVSLERRQNRARLCVEDQGPGIDAAHREDIWSPFVRLAPSCEVAGSGIGLAVVRQFVALHGGDARVEDGAVGARFVVEIPALAPAAWPAGDGAAGVDVPTTVHTAASE